MDSSGMALSFKHKNTRARASGQSIDWPCHGMGDCIAFLEEVPPHYK